MRRTALVLLVLTAMLAGCRSAAPGPTTPPPDVPSPPAPTATPTATQPVADSPAPPPPPNNPDVRAANGEFEITGLKNPSYVIFSPSGGQAVLRDDSGHYLLSLGVARLAQVPELNPLEPPTFWSEAELLWLDKDGKLQLRDLATGHDRLIHDFTTHVIHEVMPGDTHYVANREQGIVQQGYRFGQIVTGKLGEPIYTQLLEVGHLIGRMATGPVLAVEGYRGGPLWAFSPGGEKRLLSQEPAYFVQLSPDRKQALWLTGPAPKASWRDLLKPAVAHADGPYDPPLSDLWTWNGQGDPVRIPLGGTFSARAAFSPDGTRIALALGGAFLGPQMNQKPGRLAVVEGGKIRTLATIDGYVGLGPWLGADGFRYMPPMEKTGGQAPIQRIDMNGQKSVFSGGMWYEAGNRAGDRLILDWRGATSTVTWSNATRTAKVNYNPNGDLRRPLYVPDTAPYLPFATDKGGLRLLPLK